MQSINVRERRMERKERERYGASFRPSHRLRACWRNRWIERPATDNRLQRGRTYFFQDELDTKSNESLDGGSDASDRQRHFLRAPRFPFFPAAAAAAAFARGGTQLRYTMGQFARTKFNFLRPIDLFSFLSFFFSSFFFFCYGIARERRRGGKRRLRGNILWRVRGNRIANSCRDSFLASEQLRPSSFVRCSQNILTRLRFDVCTRVHRVNRSAGEGREKKKKKEMEGKETEGWTKCRGKNSNGLPSGIIWDVTMRSREQKLESRG